MKKNFDLHRLSMVLRWDILTNWQRYFWSYSRIGYRHHHAFHFHCLCDFS